VKTTKELQFVKEAITHLMVIKVYQVLKLPKLRSTQNCFLLLCENGNFEWWNEKILLFNNWSPGKRK